MRLDILSKDELHNRQVEEFSAEAAKLGAFVYDSISPDMLSFLEGRGENIRDYVEDIAFAAKGMAISLAARMRFEMLNSDVSERPRPTRPPYAWAAAEGEPDGR